MKTHIFITGSGISSKLTLLRNIRVYDAQVTELHFNNFKIEFASKKEAVKALSDAFQFMRSDYDYKDCIDYRRGSSLSYDAGSARIS